MKTTTLIYASLLLLAGAALGWTLKGCGQSPAPTVVTRVDTLTIAPDTVRLVKRATEIRTVRITDTLIVERPVDAEYAAIDTVIRTPVQIIRGDDVTHHTLVERLFVAFTGAPAYEFQLARETEPLRLDDSVRVVTQTYIQCPPNSWLEDLRDYVVYGLAAVGGLFVVLTATKP